LLKKAILKIATFLPVIIEEYATSDRQSHLQTNSEPLLTKLKINKGNVGASHCIRGKMTE
jgi:hypothetical protein